MQINRWRSVVCASWFTTALAGCVDLRSSPSSTQDAAPGGLRVVQIAAGGHHTCARMSDGTARCWGSNTSGEIGDGTTMNRLVPTMVAGITNLAEIAAAGALLSGRSPGSPDFIFVFGFTCGRTTSGVVSCWGENFAGQLGDGTTTNRSRPTMIDNLRGVVQLTVGPTGTCIRLADMTVQCWGASPPDAAFMREVQGGTWFIPGAQVTPAPVDIVGALQVVRGTTSACALTAVSGVRCWGANDFGQLGDGTMIPRPSPTRVMVNGATQVAIGGRHACAILQDGRVQCWGLGRVLGADIAGNRLIPQDVPGLTDVTEIASTNLHTCARRQDGSVWCWGYNTSGELGDGTMINRYDPTRVGGIGAATGITMGLQHSCALLADGSVWCWGNNERGQLGDGTQESHLVPVRVVGL